MMYDEIKICDEIEIMDEGITLIAHNENHQKVIIPIRDLIWRNPYEDGDDYDLPLFLTLKEISNQLSSMGYNYNFDIWYEVGIYGKIYQYTKLNDVFHWIEHGQTKGYA